MTVRILLGYESVARAAVYMVDVMKTRTMDTPNYTGLEKPTRFFVSECGELAFELYLWQQGIEYTRGTNRDGRPDNGDFVIDGQVVDVKNTDVQNARYLMMPSVQFDRHSADFYVGATMAFKGSGRAVVDLHGFCTRQAFAANAERAKVRIETMRLGLNALTPVGDLAGVLNAAIA